MDERATPRATDAPRRELDVAHVEARPLRKRTNMELRINAKMPLDLPLVQGGLRQHQRRQKSDDTAGAKCLAHLDN